MSIKHLLASLAACAAALPCVVHAADVGVSIRISEPGVYGRIDIGRFPQPQVVVAQPVIVAPPRAVAVSPQPVYLWVPPGHQKNWRKHCGRYGACGVPVYFVRDDWYHQHVAAPRDHGSERGSGRVHGHGRHRD